MFGQFQKKDCGFALVVVIVVMLMISFLASQLSLQVRTELKIATNRADHSAERMLAEGGVNLALFRLGAGNLDPEVEDTLGGPWRLGKIYDSVFPEGKMKYYAVSESGKINLNAEPKDMEPLRLFLEHHGFDVDEIAILVDSLADWGDTDTDLVRLNGAESDYYEELERPYTPRNGLIRDPGEFFLIRGTEKLQGLFDPYEVFSAYKVISDSQINFNSLTPAMLDFLTAGDQESKDLYWELSEDAIVLSSTHAQQILGIERYELFRKYLSFNLRNNPYYTIVATGSVRDVSDDGDPTSDSDMDRHDEKFGKKKKGVQVKTMISSRGNKINYLSWRISYT